MAYSLGIGDLTLDETNQALTNSGSTYQLQQQDLGQSAMGGSQYNSQPSVAASSAATQAPAQQPTGIAPPAPGEAEAPPSHNNRANSIVGGLLSTDDGGNKLGKVLSIIGNIYGGGVAQVAQGYNAVKK